MKRRNIGVVFSMIVLCLSLVAVTMMMETTTRRTRSTMRAPSEKEEEEKEEEEASTRLVRATTAEEEDFVGERRLGKEDDDEEEEDEEEEDEDDAVSSTPPLTGGPDAMPWFPEDMETRTRDITEEMRRALVDENGWRRPKMYTRREDTDALKMFDGFEKEIERFKGNAETWRKVHAVGGADSFGVVYMATGNTRFIDRAAMVASRLKAHSKSKLSKRVRFCLYTDRSLYESWMRKLVETKEKVAKEGWNAVGVTDGGGMDFTDKFKEEVHARESVRRGCVLRRVSGRVGGREVDEASRKERGETKIERWWKSIEYEFTADVFLEEDCFFSGRAVRENDLCGRRYVFVRRLRRGDVRGVRRKVSIRTGNRKGRRE